MLLLLQKLAAKSQMTAVDGLTDIRSIVTSTDVGRCLRVA